MSLKISTISLAARVDHLRKPESYPTLPVSVETKETHMSWVFLAGALAYKLTKPTKAELLDSRTIELRRKDCQREVRLNRRLATGVYYGVVPLTIDSSGAFQLEGDGQPVDWLVKMRRLPDSLMLDWQIEHNCLHEVDFRRAIAAICRFYQQSRPFEISVRQYGDRLSDDLVQSCQELVSPRYEQSDDLVRRVHACLLNYIEQQRSSLEARVRAGRVIDAHGDLRPEHICLEPRPVIIDCLQFDQRLRILDTASELSFLSLECERLGAGDSSEVIWPVYSEVCQDQPPSHLLDFYKAYHACLRAMVSAWHLKDDVPDAEKWTLRAHDYLQIAESLASRLFEE
ncbi:MAG: hypothetical protein WD049_05255 [Candidatus Paceibacterota bacterium]